jgi:hypothetical protein
MGKLKAIIVNETDKTLQLFEQTANGQYMRLANLLPNPNATVETTERSPQLKSIEGEPNYLVVEIDPNQTFWILSVWHGEDVVLSLNSDELIDNDVITIGWDTEKNMFTKHCEPRPISRVSRSMHAGSTSAAAEPDTPTDTPGVSFPSNSKVSRWRSLFKSNKH